MYKIFPDKNGIGTYKLLGNECEQIICNALKKGYRTIDTATLYKNHENIACGILKSGIPRDDIYISSKLSDKAQKKFKTDNNSIREEFFQILKDLNTTYLNQFLIHSPQTNNVLYEGKEYPLYITAYKELEKLKKEGYILNIGVSNFKIEHLKELQSTCEIKPYINQFEVHPYCTRTSLVNFCQEHNIHVQAYSSLIIGRKFEDPKLQELSKKYNVPMYILLLKWALQKNYYIIPKPLEQEQIDKNFKITEHNDLDINIILELDNLNENYYTINKYKDF